MSSSSSTWWRGHRSIILRSIISHLGVPSEWDIVCWGFKRGQMNAIIPSNKQQARHLLKEPESNQKRWNYKNLWENGYFSSTLSTLFHRDFHSKRLIPPKVLYLTCVRDKQQNPNGEFSKWWRCQERFQGHPLSDGPSPVRHAIAHLFCRLPALATWRDTYSSEQVQQRTPSSVMAGLMISFNWSMKLMVVLDN